MPTSRSSACSSGTGSVSTSMARTRGSKVDRWDRLRGALVDRNRFRFALPTHRGGVHRDRSDTVLGRLEPGLARRRGPVRGDQRARRRGRCRSPCFHLMVGGCPPGVGLMRRARGRRYSNGQELLRPSPRPGHALLHRDVGAVQLLRDARDAHPVYDRARSEWRPRVRHRTRGAIYGLYTAMVYLTSPAGRMGRGSDLGQRSGRALRRHPDRRRPLQPGLAAVTRRSSTSA